MTNIHFLPENKHHVVLSVVALLLTISSFLIISMSLQAAYLWLIIVLILMLFFTTFTCSSTVPWRQNSSITINNLTEEMNNTQINWVIDVPPSYQNATALPSAETPPPCYRKLKFSPPSYNETDSKSASPITNTESEKNKISEINSDCHPEVFSNLHTAEQNNTSVQTLNYNVCKVQSENT